MTINWKHANNLFYVELDQPESNLCTFDIKTNIMKIPDKSAEPLSFDCSNISYAEIILFRFLEARNKKLKLIYYDKRKSISDL
jgi:hypothetical protein